jgi:hypothetical protein
LTISFLNERNWIAYSPEGFFDGTTESWDLIPISLESSPWKLLSPEQLFNIYYQPGLISDILSNNKSIKSILIDRSDQRTNVDLSLYLNSKIPKVEVTHLADRSEKGKDEVFRFKVTNDGSGTRDLKVFHDNMLVYSVQGKLESKTNEYMVDVPLQMRYGRNVISAYAFNDDNLRSKEISIEFQEINNSLKKKGNAYILAIGIDNYLKQSLQLKYAVADAHLFSEELEKSLSNLKNYSYIHSYSLCDTNAAKNNIVDVLKGLGGITTSLNKKLNISRVASDDVIFIYYSGHGYATNNDFYLIPEDARISADGVTFDNLISGNEIAELLKGIDCKQIVLVIDACQSGQAISTDMDKLGPFNSRGLAQLAYEKGMYVIAASQSQQAALELDTLGHGLLTYTMIVKGLKQFEADYSPKDSRIDIIEWLNYSAENVPKEYSHSMEKHFLLKKISPVMSKISYQTPKVYFRRENYYDPLLIKKL